jgi:hypothetical protein
MKPNTDVEYGTLLEFRIKGTLQIHSNEFWGVGHSERAIDYLRSSNLNETTNYHKFTSQERARSVVA